MALLLLKKSLSRIYFNRSVDKIRSTSLCCMILRHNRTYPSKLKMLRKRIISGRNLYLLTCKCLLLSKCFCLFHYFQLSIVWHYFLTFIHNYIISKGVKAKIVMTWYVNCRRYAHFSSPLNFFRNWNEWTWTNNCIFVWESFFLLPVITSSSYLLHIFLSCNIKIARHRLA